MSRNAFPHLDAEWSETQTRREEIRAMNQPITPMELPFSTDIRTLIRLLRQSLASENAAMTPTDKELSEVREWLLDQIDGSEETRGHDSAISGQINKLDAAIQRIEQQAKELEAAKAGDSVVVPRELAEHLEIMTLEMGGKCKKCQQFRDILAAAPAPTPQVEQEPVALLLEVRDFLADGQHGQWPYVESGQQAGDMGVKDYQTFSTTED